MTSTRRSAGSERRACAGAALFVALALAMPACGGSEALPASHEPWGAALDRGFGELLAAAGAGRLPPWPAVVSSSCASPPPAAAAPDQEAFRHLAGRLLEGLERYQGELARMGAAESQRGVSDLLALRDLLAGRPGYVNLLLADTVDRVLFVELAKRIVAAGRMTAELDAAARRLERFEPEPLALLEMARSEFGGRFPTGRVDAEADPRSLYRQLMQAVSPPEEEGGFLAGLVNAGQVEAYGLLEEVDLSWFLLRLQTMDYRIQILLPMLAEYVRTADRFSPEDGYEKVRATLALTERKRRAFDSTLQQTPATVTLDVVALLEDVRSGEIDRLPVFGARPAAGDPAEAKEEAQEEVESPEEGAGRRG